MARSTWAIALLTSLLFPLGVYPLQVTPNSPCAAICQSSGSGDTSTADITCQNSDYGNTLASLRWQNCMACLETSAYSSDSQNDQMWFLYNMRYAVSTCLFQFNNSTGLGRNPCSESTACGDLQPAFENANLNPDSTTQYGYCSDNSNAMTGGSFNKCMNCVTQSDDLSYLINYIVALEVGCVQQPAVGKTIALNGSVFSSSVIGARDPNASSGSHGLSGTVIGVICLIVIIVLGSAAVGGFYFYKRRKLQQKKGGARKMVSPWGESRPRSDLSFYCQTDPEPDMSEKRRTGTGLSSEHSGSIPAGTPAGDSLSNTFAQEQEEQHPIQRPVVIRDSVVDSPYRNTTYSVANMDMNGLPFIPDDRDLPPLPVAPLNVHRAEPENRQSVVSNTTEIADYYLSSPTSTATTNFAMTNAEENHHYSLTPANYHLTARQKLTMSYRSSVYSQDDDAPVTNDATNEPMPSPSTWGWWGGKKG